MRRLRWFPCRTSRTASYRVSRETLLLLGRNEGAQGPPCWTPGRMTGPQHAGKRLATRAAAGRVSEAGRRAPAGQLGARMAADSAPITTYLMAAAPAETGKEGRELCACAQIEHVFPRELLVPLPRAVLSRAGEAPPFAAAGGRQYAAAPCGSALGAAGIPVFGTGVGFLPALYLLPAPRLPQSPAEPFSFIT